MLALCLQSGMHYRKARIWDADWIVPRTTIRCIWSNWAIRMLMFLSLVRPDLRGLHYAGFCCQSCQIRMVLIMLYGIYFIKHFFILSQLRPTPITHAAFGRLETRLWKEGGIKLETMFDVRREQLFSPLYRTAASDMSTPHQEAQPVSHEMPSSHEVIGQDSWRGPVIQLPGGMLRVQCGDAWSVRNVRLWS